MWPCLFCGTTVELIGTLPCERFDSVLIVCARCCRDGNDSRDTPMVYEMRRLRGRAAFTVNGFWLAQVSFNVRMPEVPWMDFAQGNGRE